MSMDGQRLREDIARLILAERVECPDHPPGLPKPSCWTCGRNGAFTRAARIALGRHAAPVDPGVADTEGAAVARPAASPGATWTAEELSLPGGTVLAAVDHEALVARFTAHARVLIAHGMCPLHETPLDPVRLDPARPQSRFFGGECAACGRGWSLGPVTPYAVDGVKVTGGTPLRAGSDGA